MKWVLAGFFGLVMLIAVMLWVGSKPWPLINASINYVPGLVIIDNHESGPLKDCVLTLNGSYLLHPVTVEHEAEFPAKMFLDGTKRFDSNADAVTSLSVVCESPRGTVGGGRTYNPGL